MQSRGPLAETDLCCSSLKSRSNDDQSSDANFTEFGRSVYTDIPYDQAVDNQQTQTKGGGECSKSLGPELIHTVVLAGRQCYSATHFASKNK